MSAYVVEDSTINNVVNFLYLKQNGGDVCWSKYSLEAIGVNASTTEDCRILARRMFNLNCIAINQKYSEGQAREFFHPESFEYTFRINSSITQAYKSLQCWQYQCSEGDVPTSELYKKMTKVFDLLAHHIVQTSPVYDKADWG